MQIKDALGDVTLLEDKYYKPFIDTCFRALPFHFRKFGEKGDFEASIEIAGVNGGYYLLLCKNGSLGIRENENPKSHKDNYTRISVPKDVLWKLLTKAVEWDEVKERISVIGNDEIAAHFGKMIYIMI